AQASAGACVSSTANSRAGNPVVARSAAVGVIARRFRTSFSRLVATVFDRFSDSAVRSASIAGSKWRWSIRQRPSRGHARSLCGASSTIAWLTRTASSPKSPLFISSTARLSSRAASSIEASRAPPWRFRNRKRSGRARVFAATMLCFAAPRRAMNVLLLSMPDSFEHMPAVAIRIPNGALASLAGNVDPHHRVFVADLILVQGSVRATVSHLVREIEPDVVGLSIMTFQRATALKLARLVKQVRPHARIVVGGYDPSLAPEAYAGLPEVDFIVRGEGEQTFCQLLRVLESGGDASAVAGL